MDVTRRVASGSRNWVDPSLIGFTFNAATLALSVTCCRDRSMALGYAMKHVESDDRAES